MLARHQGKNFPSFERFTGKGPTPARALKGQEADDAQRAHEALLKRMGLK